MYSWIGFGNISLAGIDFAGSFRPLILLYLKELNLLYVDRSQQWFLSILDKLGLLCYCPASYAVIYMSVKYNHYDLVGIHIHFALV